MKEFFKKNWKKILRAIGWACAAFLAGVIVVEVMTWSALYSDATIIGHGTACDKIKSRYGEDTKPVEVHLLGQATEYWCVESSGKMHRVFLRDNYFACSPDNEDCLSKKDKLSAACTKAGYGKVLEYNNNLLYCDNTPYDPGVVWNPLYDISPWEEGTPRPQPKE